jgi:hypothetical protein
VELHERLNKDRVMGKREFVERESYDSVEGLKKAIEEGRIKESDLYIQAITFEGSDRDMEVSAIFFLKKDCVQEKRFYDCENACPVAYCGTSDIQNIFKEMFPTATVGM